MVVTAVKPGAPSGLTQLNGKPHYELWAESLGASNLQLEVWQLPSTATPQLTKPVRIAGLKGRNLALIEHRVLRRLAKSSIDLGGLKPQKSKTFVVDEDLALMLGLIFRVLTPMHSRENMLACVEGIEARVREEAAYWLGMAMRRKNPRRVLASLRMLMTD